MIPTLARRQANSGAESSHAVAMVDNSVAAIKVEGQHG
jgi:hypothetical protein